MLFKVFLPVIPLLLLCLAFALTMPAAASWNNTGEFILSATFLDISHPPGFPLYSQLANFFALIPIGPIAWRVHCFSLLAGLSCVLLTYELCRYFLKHFTHAEGRLIPWVSVLPAILLTASPTFLKQIFTAEAYVVNCVFLQLLLLWYLHALHKKDLRYLILAAFCAGLFPGNHASIVIAYPPLLLLLLFRFKQYRSALLPAALLAAFGLCIFAYVPARSVTTPPLNTAGANTAERFSKLISNARDSELRVISPTNEPTPAITLKESTSALILRFVSDLQALKKEFPLIVFALAVIGIVCVILYRADVGLMILWTGLAHWYLFKGWQPDPWIPLIFILLFCATIASALVTQTLSDVLNRRLVHPAGIVVVLSAAFFCSRSILSDARHAETALSPVQFSRMQLHSVPTAALLVSDRTWFLHAYSILIEGFRSDLRPLYLGQISHPDYFAPFVLTENGQALLDSGQLDRSNSSNNLARLVAAIAPLAPLAYEPGVLFSKVLGTTGQLKANGLAIMETGTPPPAGDSKVTQLARDLAYYNNRVRTGWDPFRWEGSHFVTAYADAVGRSLNEQKQHAAAVAFYQKLCSATACSATLSNNLATSLMYTGDYGQAAALLEALLIQNLSKSERTAAMRNIRLAYAGQRRSAQQE